jgi:biopolymer transport protein ExbD
MKRKRRHDRLSPESMRLPLIALIDVVLFLLMYFLLAGSLAEQERELATTIQLPGSGGGADPFSLDPQIIHVQMEEGKPVYRLRGQTMHDRAGLRDKINALPREPGVVIRVAPNVPIAAAALAIQVSHDVGFDKVTFVPDEDARR